MARPAAPVLGPYSPPKDEREAAKQQDKKDNDPGAARGLGSTALAAAVRLFDRALDAVHVIVPLRLYKRDDVGGDGHVISK